ncbi:hypothetical protein BGX29_001413 [Mortierella sp. GBA35]|nr:hypothetical protein BGX29_001413 [Mortierella sp. GBA35]
MDSHVAQILAPQQPRSLVSALAKSCPRIQRFHVGLQQGGFHTDLVQDALTSFPRLVSLGLPTTDCTKATMDVIKSNQLRHHSSLSSSSMSLSSFSLLSEGARVAPRTTSSAFLTSLTILNVSSSEKVSQALHEFLCWTPYLKEFYAYNTTLYLEHMQPARGGGIGGGGDVVVEVQGSSTAVVAASVASSTLSNAQDQYSSRRGNSSGARAPVAVVDHSEGYVRVEQAHLDSGSDSETESSSPPAHVAHAAHAAVTVSRSTMTVVDQSNNLAPPTLSSSTPTPTPVPVATPIAGGAQMRQWACTGLETLVVRFAHLPWRTNSEPPKRSKDTFAFLAPCQNLKRLCIKEGLMLDAGREYDTLARLKALEEVVFTTCYPIPIKPSDMEWVMAVSHKSTTENDGSSSEALKRVVVRRQKANAVLDKQMHRWFDEYGCGVQLYLQLTDCCEEEYRFF